jgi:hypothetical protein
MVWDFTNWDRIAKQVLTYILTLLLQPACGGGVGDPAIPANRFGHHAFIPLLGIL